MEKYIIGIFGAVLIGYSFWLIFYRTFLKNHGKNKLCFCVYVFLAVFLLVFSYYFIKFFSYYFIKNGQEIYGNLFYNRIFTVGLAVFFGTIAVTNDFEKEERKYCRQHRQILFLFLFHGLLFIGIVLHVLCRIKTMHLIGNFLLLFSMPLYFIMMCMAERYFSRQSQEQNRAEFEAGIQQKIVYYQEMEKNQREVYKLYHDMKNHLAMIENIKGTKEVQEYIGKCMDKTRQVEGMAHTGNIYADTMLYDKWKLAQKSGIDFIMAAEKKVFDGIDIFDLTVLIGNILDNAIEAVQRETQGQRKVFFKAWKQGNLSMVMTENTCSTEPKKENGELVTGKSDKKYHGLGLKNVKEIVKKYSGKIQMGYKNGKFRVFILFYGKIEDI